MALASIVMPKNATMTTVVAIGIQARFMAADGMIHDGVKRMVLQGYGSPCKRILSKSYVLNDAVVSLMLLAVKYVVTGK